MSESSFIEIEKRTLTMFLTYEFFVFLSQIAIFFMVAVFTSNFLESEKLLVEYADLKINKGSIKELMLTFFAIAVVIGFMCFIAKILEHKKIEVFINELLTEIPKAIYFFGSSITGVILAISVYIYNNPSTNLDSGNFLFMSMIFAVFSFSYGAGISFALKRKTHIKP